MSQEIRASAQYDDMQGTIAIDGWDGISTLNVGGVGKEYWPVGLEVYAESDARGGDLDPDIYILAVDENILEGKAPEAIAKYATQHGETPVFRFRTKLNLTDLIRHIKRLSIILQDRSVENAQLMRAGPDVIFGGRAEG